MTTKADATALILAAKAKLSVTWSQIATATGLSEVYATSACLGENALDPDEASKLVTFFDLPPDIKQILTQPANKGEAAPSIPKEPLQYRLQEIIYIYGPTIKALIEEKFGNGIMSAIDFTMHIDKIEDPKGDRVQITMNGKFLAYKKW